MRAMLTWLSLPAVVAVVVVVAAVPGGTLYLHKSGRQRTELWTRMEALLETFDRLQYRDHEEISHYDDERSGEQWLQTANEELRQWHRRSALVVWDFSTNITEHTQAMLIENSKKYNLWMKAIIAEGRKFKFKHFRSDLRRQFEMFTLFREPSNPETSAKIDEIGLTMETTYNTAKVCLIDVAKKQQRNLGNDNCLSLEPDLQEIMVESRDPEELSRVWKSWRDVAGKPQRQRYTEFVALQNEGARENGYSDFGGIWRETMFPDKTDVQKMASKLWGELRPLYLQLHAYVRRRLREQYGVQVMGADGTIPAHLLGNMWAQEWDNIYPLVTPYPEASRSTKDMDRVLKSKYDVRGLFQLSEKFYSSIGLFNMTDIFWRKSMLLKPTDREVQCHASASDMFSPDDFRIKMCSDVTMEYLKTIHHEMGHVEYFMAYAHQPAIFRDGANCAIHEAIGDTIALSVLSKTHLKLLGLEPDQGASEASEGVTKAEINDLMKMALFKIGFLPFGLLVDRWRWQVFSNQTTPEHYNRDWWKLRLELQGLRSPIPRSEDDFDPAAKYHVPANSPYICYFVSHMAQFQFFKRLCEASGHQGALHLCDFDSSLEAGALFKRFMASGASRPWQDIMEEFTGSREISAEPIMEYFRPLYQWLKKDNKRHNEQLGWQGASINWEHD